MTIFDVYTSNLNVGDIPAIEQEVAPKIAAYEDSLMQNKKLFERISQVYTGNEYKSLGFSRAEIGEDYFKRFMRNGAKLDKAGQERLSEITSGSRRFLQPSVKMCWRTKRNMSPGLAIPKSFPVCPKMFDQGWQPLLAKEGKTTNGLSRILDRPWIL